MRFELLAICLFLTAGCRVLSEDGARSDEPAGNYAYEAFDLTGRKVIEGQLMIQARRGDDDSDHAFRMAGTWELRAALEDANAGPQIGRGHLSGTVAEDGACSIDLHPSRADDNVVLMGGFDPSEFDRLEGEWLHVTFTGPRIGGRFRALRVGGIGDR